MEQITNKPTVLITGGCGHIGRVITKHFSTYAKVYVCGTNKEKFQSLFFNSNVKFIQHDFNEDNQLEKKLVSNQITQIDVLINNAYFVNPSSPLENDFNDFMYGLKGTVGIYYETIRACQSLFVNKSKIINIGSMYGAIVPDFKMYPTKETINPIEYGVGKAGVVHLTKYLANYLAPQNINVNCILPGSIPSPQAQQNKTLMDSIKNKTPLKRLGTPEDLLGLITLLSSPSGDFITGQCISVDGGFSNN